MATRKSISKQTSKKSKARSSRKRLGTLSKLSSAKRNGVIFAVVFAIIGAGLLVYSFALTPGGLLDIGNGRACEALNAKDILGHTSRAQSVLKEVPGIGQACKLPNGLYKLSVGSNGSFAFTHGQDVASLNRANNQPATPRLRLTSVGGSISGEDGRTFYVRSKQVHCTTNDYHNEVIYAHAAGTPDRLSSTYLYIYQVVQNANGMLDYEAGTMGGTANFNFNCTNGQPTIRDVQTVGLPAANDFSTVYNDLVYSRGLNNRKVHYWVFIDTGCLAIYCNNGYVYADEINFASDSTVGDGSRNYNNGSDLFPHLAMARNPWGMWMAPLMLHEVGHAMGNVQNANSGNPAAPNWDPASPGHDNEVGDVMNGHTGTANIQNCVGEWRFDCGHNSYFNIHPSAGSWVSKYWQVGSRYNSYVYITY